jgi:SAM-dependent methyltransferase
LKSTLTLEEKYDYYERSVQSADSEVSFMYDEFQRHYGHKPFSLREDFCGTGAISCCWIQQDKRCEAFGIDLDPEPIEMGKKRHLSQLTKLQQVRMQYLQQNVLHAKTPPMDVICAFNFSYFIFRGRKELLQYFKSVRKSLKKQGIFYIDLFGGPESQKLVTDTKKVGKLTYYWECQHFNPVTHECTFAIHFKDAKGKKHSNVFTYHWRLWTMPELRDLLNEAGFSKVVSYWEGDDDDGGGNGEFDPADDAENCDAWVSYIAALT